MSRSDPGEGMKGVRSHPLSSLDVLTSGLPFTHEIACHLLFALASRASRPQVLEVATGYGKAAVYLAAAASQGDGHLYSSDLVEHSWQGRTARDFLDLAGVTSFSSLDLGRDARWYLLELFTSRPDAWIDLAYVDATHTVEVDAFVALAAWEHLRPGGILVFDDLDWIPAIHGGDHAGRFSSPHQSHVRALFCYLSRLPDAAECAEWGATQFEWSMGFVRKSPLRSSQDESLSSILAGATPR